MKYYFALGYNIYISQIEQVNNNTYYICYAQFYENAKRFNLKESRLYLRYLNRHFRQKHTIEYVI